MAPQRTVAATAKQSRKCAATECFTQPAHAHGHPGTPGMSNVPRDSSAMGARRSRTALRELRLHAQARVLKPLGVRNGTIYVNRKHQLMLTTGQGGITTPCTARACTGVHWRGRSGPNIHGEVTNVMINSLGASRAEPTSAPSLATRHRQFGGPYSLVWRVRRGQWILATIHMRRVVCTTCCARACA